MLPIKSIEWLQGILTQYDYTSITSFEASILILLSNIFFITFLYFILNLLIRGFASFRIK